MPIAEPRPDAADTHVVVDTDGGVLWCNGSGTVIYNGGASRTAAPTLALPAAPPATGYQIVNAFPGLTFEDALALADLAKHLKGLPQRVLHNIVRLLTGSAADFLDDYFDLIARRGEEIRARQIVLAVHQELKPAAFATKVDRKSVV